MHHFKFVLCFCAAQLFLLPAITKAQGLSGISSVSEIKHALTFFASFDDGVTADYSAGDSTLYVAPRWEGRSGTMKPYTNEKHLRTHEGEGLVGDALWIENTEQPVYFYRGEHNINYSENDWEGTVSFWLRLSPDEDLADGYSDPIQLTDSAWNDGALYVDFTYQIPRVFRFAFFAEREVWDPKLRDWEDIPVEERPMVEVKEPFFSRDRWTHVAFAFRNFNTGEENGTVDCFINGEFYGSLTGREQTLNWNTENAAIWLGYNYTGYFDELSIYNKALSAEQIQMIYSLENGVGELLDN